MSIINSPSHVAVLVPSALRAAEYLQTFDFHIGTAQEHDSEGTREIYVEQDRANSLLLIEPIKPGPYQQALIKRGPGLHHIAIDVLKLESFIDSLAGTGWLLHPSSIRTIKLFQTAYVARPGFPCLIEVQEKKSLQYGSLFIDGINLDFDFSLLKLVQCLGLESIVKASPVTELSLAGHIIPLKNLML